MNLKNRLNKIEARIQPKSKYKIPKGFALYGTGFIADSFAGLLEAEMDMRIKKGWVGYEHSKKCNEERESIKQ